MLKTSVPALAAVKKSAVLAALAVFGVLAVMPAANAASDHPCPPTGAGVVEGNLVVPAGAFCVFGPGTVKGNVIARENSDTVLRDVVVEGNVEAFGANALWIVNLTNASPTNVIKGNVHLVGGGPSVIFTHEVVFCNMRVEHGNIQIEKRTGSILMGRSAACANRVEHGGIKIEDNFIPPTGPDFMEVSFNTMAWNLQVFKNTGPGFKFVQNNTHLGALQCKENTAPFFGGPNNGPGPDDRGDQCFDTVP